MDLAPEPGACLRVRAVDQRAGPIIADGQAIDGVAILVLEQPAFSRQHVEIARLPLEARPYANDGAHAHRFELVVHPLGVWKIGAVDVQLPHAGPVEPVEYHHVERIASVAIAFGDTKQFLLAFVSRLALDEAESRFGWQGCFSGQLCIAGVDFVRCSAGNDEEGHSLAHLALPMGAAVQTRPDQRTGRIVPDNAITLVRHHEGHADRFTRRRIIIMFAVNLPTLEVENAILILPEAIIMLVGWRIEAGADLEGLLAIHAVRRHFPARHSR